MHKDNAVRFGVRRAGRAKARPPIECYSRREQRALRRSTRCTCRFPKMTMTFARATLASLAVIFVLAGFPSVHAQQPAPRIARIGVLLFGTPETDPNLAAFVGGLRELG